MAKKNFTLMQHTPLIQFQYDQAGATLRPSEVKPKLDKFILARMGGFETVFSQHPTWFVGCKEETKFKDAKPALNYKMRFSCQNGRIEDVPRFGMYYANTGENANIALYQIGDCSMEIVCFIPELLEIIAESAPGFFVVTNFGRMQSKGFGSYTVSHIDGIEVTMPDVCAALAQECEAPCVYSFDSIPRNDDETREDLFGQNGKIKLLYTVMKSGYNVNNNYHRSYLFEYFYELGMGNEKAYLKKNGYTPRDPRDRNLPYKQRRPLEHPLQNREYADWTPTRGFYFVRGVLGLGERFEYITGFVYDEQRRRYKPRSGEAGRTKIKIEHESIKRYASPVFFKVIENTVYFAAKRVDKAILDQSFTFTNSSNHTVTIRTPESFDIDGFLAYFYKRYNNENGWNAPGYGIGTRIAQQQIGGNNE